MLQRLQFIVCGVQRISSLFHSADSERIRSISSAAFLKENVLWLLSLRRNAVEMVITGNETISSPRETKGIVLHNFSCSFVRDTTVCFYCRFYESQSPNLNKPLLNFVSWFAYLWTPYSVISQIAEDSETKRSKEMLYLNAARVLRTTNSHAVALDQCFNLFSQCSKLWHKHLHFTIM